MPEQDMTPERLLGQAPTSFEERQVAAAITKARALRPDLYPMSGGAGLPDVITPLVSGRPELLLSSEEREKREQRAAYLSGFADRLSTTDDPDAMRRLVREFMTSLEKVVEMPDIQRIDMIRNVLAEKAGKFRDAQDPEYARLTGLDREGLVEKKVTRRVLQENTLGLFEMELSAREASVLRAAGKDGYISEDESGIYRLSFPREHVWELQRDPQIKKILDKKETVTIPALYTPDQLKKISETAEELRKEVLARTKIFIAYYLYQNSSFSLSLLAGLDARYTGISTDEWKTLVTLKETKEGEPAYGDKIDAGLRLLCLVAEIGGDKEGGGKLNEGDYREREEKLKQLIDKQPQYLQYLIKTYSATDDEDGKMKSGVEWLMKVSKKNMFAKPASGTYDLKEVRERLEKIIGGEGNDTQTAVEIAYKLFRMWGIAAHYDHKSWKKDKKTGGGAFVPFGPAVSDCTAGLQYFESDRKKDLMDGYPHGPDATLGKYPETIMKSFLHSTLCNMAEDKEQQEKGLLKDTRSLWELWWNKGCKLSDLPWDRAGNGAWFRYNYQLSNIGKKEKGLNDMVMTPLPAQKLMDTETLRDIYKAVKLSITAITIHRGEIEEFLRNEPGAGEYNSGALEENFLEPLREKIRELVLIGAITSDYQNNGMEAMKHWGEWATGDANAANNARIIVRRVMEQAGWGDKDWWEKNIRDQAKKFLKPQGLV